MTIIPVHPLTKAAFAPFGEVVDIDGAAAIPINQGFAERRNGLAAIDVARGGGSPQVCLFVAEPRTTPIAPQVMERHPDGSQMFYPLQDRVWLVLVCGDPLDDATYRAFLASGRQGVNYARDVWHHPLLVFDPGSRFIVVDRAGPGANLEEHWIAPERNLRLARIPDQVETTA